MRCLRREACTRSRAHGPGARLILRETQRDEAGLPASRRGVVATSPWRRTILADAAPGISIPNGRTGAGASTRPKPPARAHFPPSCFACAALSRIPTPGPGAGPVRRPRAQEGQLILMSGPSLTRISVSGRPERRARHGACSSRPPRRLLVAPATALARRARHGACSSRPRVRRIAVEPAASASAHPRRHRGRNPTRAPRPDRARIGQNSARAIRRPCTRRELLARRRSAPARSSPRGRRDRGRGGHRGRVHRALDRPAPPRDEPRAAGGDRRDGARRVRRDRAQRRLLPGQPDPRAGERAAPLSRRGRPAPSRGDGEPARDRRLRDEQRDRVRPRADRRAEPGRPSEAGRRVPRARRARDRPRGAGRLPRRRCCPSGGPFSALDRRRLASGQLRDARPGKARTGAGAGRAQGRRRPVRGNPGHRAGASRGRGPGSDGSSERRARRDPGSTCRRRDLGLLRLARAASAPLRARLRLRAGVGAADPARSETRSAGATGRAWPMPTTSSTTSA